MITNRKGNNFFDFKLCVAPPHTETSLCTHSGKLNKKIITGDTFMRQAAVARMLQHAASAADLMCAAQWAQAVHASRNPNELNAVEGC